MNYKVLLTTSGLGSRLGELTDYTNKCLVRIGNKPAISLIIENYPIDTEFVVTLGYYGEYVRDFLELAYPERNFTFVEVDNYRGPKSSLGYSILQARDHLQCPFIFNACDTLFSDKKVIESALKLNENFCIGEVREDSTQYATLLCDNDKLVEIKQKGEMNYDYAYVGFCGIKDYELFWNLLSETIKQNPFYNSLHEGIIINKMLKKVEFRCLKTNCWLDIGNVGELEKTRNFYSSFAEVLEKKQESIYFFDDFVIKFFSDSKINLNRVARAELLSGLVPKIIDYRNNFYKYELADGDLLSSAVNVPVFKNYLNWVKNNLWIPKEAGDFESTCHNFYINKTNKRIKMFLDETDDKETTINGIKIPDINTLIDLIDIEWLCSGIPVQFHGDFILDNALINGDNFCLLDWRQDFGGLLDCGDLYYDLAKLNHNLTINHEIVNKGLYNHVAEDCKILCSSTLSECKDELKNFIIKEGYDYKKVSVLTSLVWINMAPLHEYPFNKFLFNFGKYNLYKALNYEY
jgi:NDP-sugar pyrophosphorylase family protein